MKKTLVALAISAALLPSLVHAEAGDIVVRLRATNINPDESSKLGKQTFDTYNTDNLYGNRGAELRVDSNTIPELDVSYYFTKNIAAELILALGTKHDVSISGLAAGATVSNKNLGEVNLLPPTLTLQWHFNPDQTFDPYVGAGVSYVRAMDRSLRADIADGSTRSIHISRDAFGPAIQAGFDYNLENKWLINFDVKKIWFDTKVTLDLNQNGDYKKIDNLDIDPWVISVGFGKKF